MKLRRHRFLLSVLLLALCFALSSCSAAGFVPKSDTTWGELFRHFDSEEFSELDQGWSRSNRCVRRISSTV